MPQALNSHQPHLRVSQALHLKPVGAPLVISCFPTSSCAYKPVLPLRQLFTSLHQPTASDGSQSFGHFLSVPDPIGLVTKSILLSDLTLL